MPMSQSIQMLKATERLPSPQGVALEVVRLCQSEDLDLSAIARVVQSDPALVGKILKATNVSLGGARRSITTINDALMVLGLMPVRNLVLAFSLINDYQRGDCKTFDHQVFWQKSFMFALAAQLIGGKIQLQHPDELFVCGLLAEIGQLSLATVYPAQYSELLLALTDVSDRLMRRAHEQRVLALDHVEVTLFLLESWGVSQTAFETVLHYLEQDPDALLLTSAESEVVVDAKKMTRQLVLSVASALVDVLIQDDPKLRANTTDLLFLAAKIGIENDGLQALLSELRSAWHDWRALLKISGKPLNEGELLSSKSAASPFTEKLSSLRCLVVDDDTTMLVVLKKTLQHAGHHVITANNGVTGLELLLTERPEVVITDWVMPVMDGVQLVKSIRETEFGKHAYVLLLTSFEQEERLIEAFDAGVDDYIRKPFIPRVLLARLRAAERFIQLQRAFSQELQEIRRFASELAINNRKLQQAALTDSLTNLPNRRYGMERLEQEIALAKRRSACVSVVVADVDYFKMVNDHYGHDVGDVVLKFIADVFTSKSRLQDVICRMGGEEFLIICPDTNVQDALNVAERLRAAISVTPFIHDKYKIQVTLSFGVAALQNYEQMSQLLLKQADQAMYRAKNLGRNRVVQS